LTERSINTLITPWPPQNGKILVVKAKIDREVVIPACKRVQPWIEAVVKAKEDFFK
jgi:hypothetical protein